MTRKLGPRLGLCKLGLYAAVVFGVLTARLELLLDRLVPLRDSLLGLPNRLTGVPLQQAVQSFARVGHRPIGEAVVSFRHRVVRRCEKRRSAPRVGASK